MYVACLVLAHTHEIKVMGSLARRVITLEFERQGRGGVLPNSVEGIQRKAELGMVEEDGREEKEEDAR